MAYMFSLLKWLLLINTCLYSGMNLCKIKFCLLKGLLLLRVEEFIKHGAFSGNWSHPVLKSVAPLLSAPSHVLSFYSFLNGRTQSTWVQPSIRLCLNLAAFPLHLLRQVQTVPTSHLLLPKLDISKWEKKFLWVMFISYQKHIGVDSSVYEKYLRNCVQRMFEHHANIQIQ